MSRQEVHQGDCLELMAQMQSGTVDLVYADPPFGKGRNFGAFDDRWAWDEETACQVRSLEGTLERLVMLTHDIHSPRMAAYLCFMGVRVVEMHRVLKRTGTLWIHLDDTANAYVRLLLDLVFGESNRRDEVTYGKKAHKQNATKSFANGTDTLFRYTKTRKFTFNTDAITIPYNVKNPDAVTLKKYNKIDKDGRRYKLEKVTNPNSNRPNLRYELMGITRTWVWTQERMMKAVEEGRVIQTRPGNLPVQIQYLDEQKGIKLNNRWHSQDLDFIKDERTGYPTQKPIALAERIIKVSSHPGDLVLEPFCGSGPTLVAAKALGRRAIGFDVNPDAVQLAQDRLQGQTEAML